MHPGIIPTTRLRNEQPHSEVTLNTPRGDYPELLVYFGSDPSLILSGLARWPEAPIIRHVMLLI